MNSYLFTKTANFKAHITLLSNLSKKDLEYTAVYLKAWLVEQVGMNVKLSLADDRPEFLLPEEGVVAPSRKSGALESEAESRSDTLWGDAKRLVGMAVSYATPNVVRATRINSMTDLQLELQSETESKLVVGTPIWIRIAGCKYPWRKQLGESLKGVALSHPPEECLIQFEGFYKEHLKKRRKTHLAIAAVTIGVWMFLSHSFSKLGPPPNIAQINSQLDEANRAALGADYTAKANTVMKALQATDPVVYRLVDSLQVAGSSNSLPILSVFVNRSEWLQEAKSGRLSTVQLLCKLWLTATSSNGAKVQFLVPPPVQHIPERIPANWRYPQAYIAGGCNDNTGNDAWTTDDADIK